MYYVYILLSKLDDKFYIGYAENLNRRIKEHKAGLVHTTVRYSDLNLIFYECFLSKRDALRRERYFKTTKGKKSLRLIVRDSLDNIKSCPVV